MFSKGDRVKVSGETGYIYTIDNGWYGIILDRVSHKSNPPIQWATEKELELLRLERPQHNP